MKIIKHGDLGTGWKTQVICKGSSPPGCGAVLEVETEDLVVKYYDGDFRDPAYYSANVTCPDCSKILDVGGVPEGVLYYRYHKGAR